jgi:hypothetical protein
LYPLWFHNGSLVAGFDYFNYNWNLWWLRHATSTPGLNVFMSNYVLAPFMNNFGYHALAAFWYPVWALVEPLGGTLTAVNLIIALGCFLNGFMLFVFLRQQGVHPSLALVGGAALQLSPICRYFYYNTHLNLMDWFWLPTNLLLWSQIARVAQTRRLKPLIAWSVLHGVVLYGVGLTDLQFPIFTSTVLLPYGLWTLIQSSQFSVPSSQFLVPFTSSSAPGTQHPALTTGKSKFGILRSALRTWNSELATLIAAGVLVLTVALALLWFVGPLPYMRQFTGTLAPGIMADRPGIPFPAGYLTMFAVWWHWNTPTMGGFVTLATLASVLVSFTPLRQHLRRERWFWLIVSLPPLIFSMGPTIQVFGADIPMPYRWLHQITNGMLRMPWRLGPAFVVAAMIFVCLTWSPLLARLRAGRTLLLAGVFLLLTYDTRLFETGPLQPVLPSYTFYDDIGQERGPAYDNLVLLEVPTAAGTGEILVGDSRAISFQYYGMRHHKRMLNGFISRIGLENFWYIRADDPMLSWLGQRRFLEPANVEQQLRERIPAWPIGYVVVHQDVIGKTAVANQEVIGYLNSLGDLLCPVTVEGDAILYRTSAHPDGCPPRTPPETAPGDYTLDIGAPDDVRYLGLGWHWPEAVGGLSARWTGQYPDAKLYVDLPPGDYRLSLRTQAFHRDRNLKVFVNGQSVGEQRVRKDDLTTLDYRIPAALLDDGRPVTIRLAYDGTDTPKALSLADSDRPLALMVDWVRFKRTSLAS